MKRETEKSWTQQTHQVRLWKVELYNKMELNRILSRLQGIRVNFGWVDRWPLNLNPSSFEPRKEEEELLMSGSKVSKDWWGKRKGEDRSPKLLWVVSLSLSLSPESKAKTQQSQPSGLKRHICVQSFVFDFKKESELKSKSPEPKDWRYHQKTTRTLYKNT